MPHSCSVTTKSGSVFWCSGSISSSTTSVGSWSPDQHPLHDVQIYASREIPPMNGVSPVELMRRPSSLRPARAETRRATETPAARPAGPRGRRRPPTRPKSTWTNVGSSSPCAHAKALRARWHQRRAGRPASSSSCRTSACAVSTRRFSRSPRQEAGRFAKMKLQRRAGSGCSRPASHRVGDAPGIAAVEWTLEMSGIIVPAPCLRPR